MTFLEWFMGLSSHRWFSWWCILFNSMTMGIICWFIWVGLWSCVGSVLMGLPVAMAFAKMEPNDWPISEAAEGCVLLHGCWWTPSPPARRPSLLLSAVTWHFSCWISALLKQPINLLMTFSSWDCSKMWWQMKLGDPNVWSDLLGTGDLFLPPCWTTDNFWNLLWFCFQADVGTVSSCQKERFQFNAEMMHVSVYLKYICVCSELSLNYIAL